MEAINIIFVINKFGVRRIMRNLTVYPPHFIDKIKVFCNFHFHNIPLTSINKRIVDPQPNILSQQHSNFQKLLGVSMKPSVVFGVMPNPRLFRKSK